MTEQLKHRIREIRIARGISGTKLAELLDISPQYYYNLENGGKRLHEDILIELAKIFNVSTDYILGLSAIPCCEDPLSDLPEFVKKRL